MDDLIERLTRKLAGRGSGAAVERALELIERLGTLRGKSVAVLDAGGALLDEFGLSPEPLRALASTLAYVREMGVDDARLEVNLGLSRGLQYYTGMVFEIEHGALGSESQLCGGGRYDELVRALGGRQATPALGFAFGVERVALALLAEDRQVTADPACVVLVIPAGPEANGEAARTAQALRVAGVRTHLDVSARSVRASLQFADREGFSAVVVAGEAPDTLRLRWLAGGEERVLSLSGVRESLARGEQIAVARAG